MEDCDLALCLTNSLCAELSPDSEEQRKAVNIFFTFLKGKISFDYELGVR